MKKIPLKKIASFVCFSLLAASSLSHAKDFPHKTVRVITPFQAGNVLDAAARDVAQRFQQNTGTVMIVENKPGGDGIIAAQSVKNAKDQGHSLLISTTSMMGINPFLFESLGYDPIEDFTQISNMIGMTLVLAVRADNPSNSLKEFIEWVKNKPNGATYASFIASSQYLGALLNERAGMDMINIPFNGTPVAVQNLIGKHVDAAVLPLSAIKKLTDANELKVLAVSIPERSELLPGVPTFKEEGYDELTTHIWAGLSAPKNTPPDQVEWLNKEITKILSDPVLKEKWATLDMTPLPSTPKEFQEYIQADQKLWGQAIEAFNHQEEQ